MIRSFLLRAAVTVLVSSLAACKPADDDAERFRDAIPQQSEVSLGVPGTTANTGTTSQGLHIRTEGTGAPAATPTNAKWYGLTRDFTAGVDLGTAVILGGIWAIVHTAPTSLEDKKAVWGPGAANALEPAVWRFTVTEVGDKEYDYVLEGQRKAGGNWLPVLNGHGFGKERAEHRQGWFVANNDNYKTLEPTWGHDQGTTKITYDLRQLPATIAVEMRPGTDKGSIDITVTHEAGGAGSIVLTGIADLDPSKATKLENIDINSRWATTGAGRADVNAANGDLPVTVDATECWSTSFARVYYKDSANFEPEAGDATSCAFAAASAFAQK